MSTTELDPYRVTVHGPRGRADLAVPIGTTVGSLLPLLVRRLVPIEGQPDEGSWVLQRLGGPPMDPDGAPETLDWLDGDELHLTPAESPLPELDFDDVGDGIATAVNRQGDRWNDAVKRRFFLVLAAAAVLAAGTLLVIDGSRIAAAVTTGVLGAVLGGVALLVARGGNDLVLAGLAAAGGCLMIGLGVGLATVGGAGVVALTATALVPEALATATAAGVLLCLRIPLSAPVPVPPLGVLVALGGSFGLAAVMDVGGSGRAGHSAAAGWLLVLLVFAFFAPRLAIRSARLRGPQLPRTSEELQVDVEPAPAAEVVRRTAQADRILTIIAVTLSLVSALCLVALVQEPDWKSRLVAGLAGALLLLRAREFLNNTQRISLTLAGSVGVVAVLFSLVMSRSAQVTTSTAVGLVGVGALLAIAAHRPAYRRVLPIWVHLANISETLCALTLVPMVFQLLGLFAWARGLAG